MQDVTLTERKFQFSTTQLVKSFPEHFRYGADEWEIVVRVPADQLRDVPSARPGSYRFHHRDLHYVILSRDSRDMTPESLRRRREYFEAVDLPSLRGNLLPAGSVPLVVLHDLREAALRREFNSLGYSDLFDLYLFAVPGRYCFEPDDEERL
jgi:hypothetical protein